MRRRDLLTVASIAVVLVVAACGGSTSGTAVPASGTVAGTSEEQTAPASAETELGDGTESTENDLDELFAGSGVLSLEVGDVKYRGTATNCIVDGGTDLLKVNLQIEAVGETDAGEPFYSLISHVEQDADGDGEVEALITISLIEGQDTADENVSAGNVRIFSQTNTSERSGFGDIEVQLSERGMNGWGTANDLNGIMAGPDEPLGLWFFMECL